MTNLSTLEVRTMETPIRTDLQCTVCRKHKANLRPRKSRLMPGMPVMFLCGECFEAKREPRFAVILVARDKNNGGLEIVRDYIRHHRYYGDKIRAEELI